MDWEFLDEELPCPQCGKNSCTYEYKSVKRIYCTICQADFYADTGMLCPESELDWDDEDCEDEVEKPQQIHRTYITKERTWKCNAMEKSGENWVTIDCPFETAFFKESSEHEDIYKPPEDDKHYTSWSDDGPKCKFCSKTFKNWTEANAHDTQAGRIAYNKLKDAESGRTSTSGTFTGSTYIVQKCTHEPHLCMENPEKTWSVSFGKKWDCERLVNNYDLILNLSGTSIQICHDIPVKELKKWESKTNFTEIMLDWPDMGVVDLPIEFWQDFIAYVKKNKLKVLTFCIGGHGRTGTALASLLVTEFKYSPKEACDWVWTNYCQSAIENNAQIDYVYKLVGEKYIPDSTSYKNHRLPTQQFLDI